MRRWPGGLFLFTLIILLPALAHAQAALSGSVRDASGAVLPGVTVEASSPALIEKVRTAVTDGSGQYRITELTPGSYVLTFSLSGFTTVKRDGITVSGSGVIAINVELGVGTLSETVTVSGEAPLVDTQSTRRESVITAETLSTLPITRSYGAVLYAVPGLAVAPGVGGNDLVPSMATFSAHGGNSTEGRMLVDGLSVAGPFSGNSVAQFAYDVTNAQELQVLVSGGLGEAETGGPLVNLIPKSGGNSFNGAAFYSGTTARFQSNNVDDELRRTNITQPPAIRQNFDGSGSLGGPIKRDSLWFFGSARTFGNAQVVEGTLPNANAGNAAEWLYVPETGVEIRRAESKVDLSLRLTGQVTTRNRVSFSHQYQDRCLGSSMKVGTPACRTRADDWIAMGTTTAAPEASAGYGDDPSTLTQATWTSTISSRLLFDSAISRFSYGIVGNGQFPSDASSDLIGVQEQSGRYGRPNLAYRGFFTYAKYDTVPWGWRAAMSYVTGAHSAKVGYQGALQKYRLAHGRQRHPAALLLQRGRADRRQLLCRPVVRFQQSHRDPCGLRSGSVDQRAHDAAGCLALRLRDQLGAGRGQRIVRDLHLQPAADRLRAHGERARLPRPQPANGRGAGSVRHREDGAEGERRPVPLRRDRRRDLFGQ